MAKADSSIEPRILEFARKEFLNCGYKKASLKTICQNAGVTTGAFYKRFSCKEELLQAIITPTLFEFEERLKKSEWQDSMMPDWCVLFVLDHSDVFRLLLMCQEMGLCMPRLGKLTEVVIYKQKQSRNIDQQRIALAAKAYLNGLITIAKYDDMNLSEAMRCKTHLNKLIYLA